MAGNGGVIKADAEAGAVGDGEGAVDDGVSPELASGTQRGPPVS
jgi:hypothetical protein